MNERVYQHVVTKSGESYTGEVGVYPCDGPEAFNVHKNINDLLQHGNGMLLVDNDCFVAIDCIARINYTRHEVH